MKNQYIYVFAGTDDFGENYFERCKYGSDFELL